MSNAYSDLAKKIDSYRDEMIELQRGLTAIPAISPESGGEGEMKKTQFLIDYLKRIGLTEIERFDVPDDRVPDKVRPNLTVRLKGKDSSRTFWIMAHTDVVPPGDLEKWSGDPYELRVDGDFMYGRGVEDNQQGLVSGVFALKAFVDLGIKPEFDTALIIVADEETSSKFGIEYVLENHNLFKKDDLIVVPDAGEPDSKMIEVAEKSILWMKIHTTGKQCHGSTPDEGINAHRAAAHLITTLDGLYQEFPNRDPVYDPPQSTFEPTRKLENVENVNTIPGDDTIFYDCRVLPEYDTDDVIDYVRKKADEVESKFGVKIEITTPQHGKAAPPTPNDATIVKVLSKGIKEVYGVEAKPMGIGGGTVAAFFRRHGFDAAVWSTLEDTCHQPDERARVSFMVNDTKIFAHVMLNGV